MHSLFGKRGVMLAGLLALGLAAITPTAASAKPEPGARGRSFRLFARSLGALTVNRVYCGLATTGEVCVDSTNSSTIGGGYWPKGTADQYIFNSGLQLAGVVGGTKPSNPWGGDTTGAFFFDPKGTTQHGQEVQPIFNSQNPDDAANWPAAAKVPLGDATAGLYHPLLQGRIAASQGDVWFLSWEGNPNQNAGRSHPLGVLVETRGMGWNFPSGNEDILYFVYTFYNITSTNAADYASARPDMQPILLQQAQAFHAQNDAAFGVTLPAAGYTINSLYAAFARDDDVANANVNYASVNLPFALGFTYEQSFSKFAGWTFDPAIFSPPFFAGAGFTGAKYLKSPSGPGQIQLFSNTTNGGAFNDARDTKQLFRYLSGTPSQAAGDQSCNNGDPTITRVCYVLNGTAFDMRFFQSSTPLDLAPGAFGSIVVAYIFAPPVITASVVPTSSLSVKPGDPLLLDPKTPAAATALATTGANVVDSLTGFRSWTDVNGDCASISPTSTVGCAQQNEFTVVPGSLLGKAKTAQAVFDGKFLLPFAPESPDFFLVPGDNQVTVLWRPTASETTGDPFFAIANAPTVIDPISGLPTANALYDPNYRQFDVEGYRIYRGRVDAPNALTMLAQFDYGGTSITDYAGQVNPSPTCAPELAVYTSGCPYDNPFPAPGSLGQARTKNVSVPLVGEITQAKLGERSKLATGAIIVLIADTALTGRGGSCAPSACPVLKDTGVPFVYVDKTVRNNFRYFYSVTAFDINSFQSGPSNLESPRLTKSVTPVAAASNYNVAGLVTGFSMTGRGVALDSGAPKPTLDPVTGIFSGPFPPANGWSIGLADFVATVLSQPGNFTVQQDSVQLGSAYDNVPVQYFYHVVGSSPNVIFSVPVLQGQELGPSSGAGQFAAVPIDQALAARFGGSNQFNLQGKITQSIDGTDYAGLYGRGCVNGRAGFDVGGGCSYNGARWFAGPSPQNNETMADPNGNDVANFSGDPMPNFSNAGALPGVVTIHETKAYQTVGGGEYRPTSGVLAGAFTSADYNVYWGAAGAVDSVIDAVHHISLPFDTAMGASWGILNAGDVPATGSYDTQLAISNTDFGCVYPLRGKYTVSMTCASTTVGAPIRLKRTAVPGPVIFADGGSLANFKTATPQPNNGFGMYLAGHIFTFELTGGAVPASGTVWSMRSYIGAITGGNGAGAGNLGPYAFDNPEGKRTLAAPGVQLAVQFDVTNKLVSTSRADLERVHTVPDPYYVTSEFEQTTDTKIIKFVNLPNDAIIRIYSSSGVLVNILEHHSNTFAGSEDWNVRNRNNQVVASGVYFYHIESGDARRVGRFTIVNFAQ